jgi:alpha-L-fucosidase
LGDYGTPEQEIPPTGVPGLDWETCMTMNRNWGYNRADKDFKPPIELIRNLVDIASKGGNFLLNVGPTADGTFPPESVDRLKAIGAWMAINSASIYGTEASPFLSLPWGRCTVRRLDRETTRLYLHVFDRPRDNILVVPGLLNDVRFARPLTAVRSPYNLAVTRQGDDLRIAIGPPAGSTPAMDEVFVLDIAGEPDVTMPPVIEADAPIFVGAIDVRIATARRNVELRYTTDGREPDASSTVAAGPVHLTSTATVRARAFRGARAVSGVTEATFTQVTPRPAAAPGDLVPGLKYAAVAGDYSTLPDFAAVTGSSTGAVSGFDLTPRPREVQFAMRFDGYIRVPATGVYTFFLRSDDGSRMWMDGALLIDNDGLHSSLEKSAPVAVEQGLHPIAVAMFEQSGGFELDVSWSGPGVAKQRVPVSALFRRK